MNRFLIGQDYNLSGSAGAGFNRRVSGESHSECFRYDSERQDRELYGGWDLADRLIQQGKIFSLHRAFHTSHEGCNLTWSSAFSYGGTIVCNGCQCSNLAKDWWWIKCFMDGNAWMCHGPDFENLQESENFAFGDTREDAIKNYGDTMIAILTKAKENEL